MWIEASAWRCQNPWTLGPAGRQFPLCSGKLETLFFMRKNLTCPQSLFPGYYPGRFGSSGRHRDLTLVLVLVVVLVLDLLGFCAEKRADFPGNYFVPFV